MQRCEAGMHRSRSSWVAIAGLCLLVVPASRGQMFSNALQQKAKSGDVDAMLKVAQAYESGSGIEADPAEAARWYEHAANSGDPGAQTKIALLYLQGVGVAKDPREAVHWLLRAASSGYG